MGRFDPGAIMVMINRGTYWQCAYVIPKGGIDDVKALLVVPEVSRELDLDALQRYLTLSYVPGPATMVKAIRWIADLGGYVGNRGSGPPGATTIARGLERVDFAAALLLKLKSAGRLR